MTYRNDFAKHIAENVAIGDKSYAHNIRCWERNIRKIVMAAIANGLSVGVNDGEETVLTHSKNVPTIMRALFSTDEDYLLFYKENEKGHFAWVRLIYGNGPDEVVNDYSTNIEYIMKPINEWVSNTLF